MRSTQKFCATVVDLPEHGWPRPNPRPNNIYRGELPKTTKTSVVLIELTVSYDTDWRKVLIDKVICIMPSTKTVINKMLYNRPCQVIISNNRSKSMKVNNGLLHGLVLAPLRRDP